MSSDGLTVYRSWQDKVDQRIEKMLNSDGLYSVLIVVSFEGSLNIPRWENMAIHEFVLALEFWVTVRSTAVKHRQCSVVPFKH